MNTLETLQIKLLAVKTSQKKDKNHEYDLMTWISMAFPHEIPDHSCISSNSKAYLGNIA